MKFLILTLLAPLRWLVRLLLALLILFEEWGWEPLSRGMAWIGRLPVFRQMERAIKALPPYAALGILLLPTLALLPVKLLALWLISIGRTGIGLLVILLAKLVGTALVARLFQLTQPALLQLPWFARIYARWSAWKTGLLDWVHASPFWQAAQAWKQAIKSVLRRR
jgi:hypothetical protein